MKTAVRMCGLRGDTETTSRSAARCAHWRRTAPDPSPSGSAGSGAIAARRESGIRQPLLHLLAVEALPDVAELDDVFHAIVRHQVDDQQPAAGLEHAPDLAHRLRRIGDEVRDEKQHGGVERAVVDRQRLDRSLAQLDVVVLRRAAPWPRRASAPTRRRRSPARTHGASASVMWPAPHPRSPTTQRSSSRSSSASRSVRAPIMSVRILSHASAEFEKEELRLVAALGEHALGAPRVLRRAHRAGDLRPHDRPQVLRRGDRAGSGSIL